MQIREWGVHPVGRSSPGISGAGAICLRGGRAGPCFAASERRQFHGWSHKKKDTLRCRPRASRGSMGAISKPITAGGTSARPVRVKAQMRHKRKPWAEGEHRTENPLEVKRPRGSLHKNEGKAFAWRRCCPKRTGKSLP